MRNNLTKLGYSSILHWCVNFITQNCEVLPWEPSTAFAKPLIMLDSKIMLGRRENRGHEIGYSLCQSYVSTGIRVLLLIWPWWRHQMETFSALLAICAGNSPVPVKSPHKGQWRGALMFSLIYARINSWVNNGGAGDLRRHRIHYDVTVMVS